MSVSNAKNISFKSSLGLRLILLGAGLLSYAITSGQYVLTALAFISIEVIIWCIYAWIKRKNEIISFAFWMYCGFSPELFLGVGGAIFCYGGIFRIEAWILLGIYLIGLVYTQFIFRDYDFDTKTFKQNIMKGHLQAWPSWGEIDWFGKLYLYSAYVPIFPALIMFGGAMWATDLPPEEQHKYIMAGGYAFMFLGMALSATRIWFRRVIRTVKEYDLDWVSSGSVSSKSV